MALGNWLGPEEVMELMGVSRWTYNHLCADGQFEKCRKINNTWYVHKSEFE